MKLEIRNEKGYTLLVVLLVVTFIMIISASFVTASVSNAKQEKIVDTNNLAVVAAEMGVDYYKTAMLNTFINKRNELIISAQLKVNSFISDPEFDKSKVDANNIGLKKISAEIAEELKVYLEDEIGRLIDEKEINAAVQFRKKALNVVVDKNLEQVIAKGIVLGQSTNENPRELEFSLMFDFLDLSEVDFAYSLVEGIPQIDFENPVSGSTICSSQLGGQECLFDNIENSTVYFKDGYINPKNSTNNKNFKNSNIYVKGDIDVKNLNGMSNVYINVSGKFLAENFQSELGINNSTIVIGESMEGKNILVTNSTIIVNGDFKAKELKVIGNSKVCVNGKLSVEGPGHLTIKNLSEIYVKLKDENGNQIDHKYDLHLSDKGPVMLSRLEYSKVCSGGITTFPSIEDDWNEPIIDVEY